MNFKPDNMPQLSVYLIVADVDKSIDFYSKAFGFELSFKTENDPANTHVEMKKGESVIMFCNKGAFGNTKKTPKELGMACPINSYVYTEDTDALYKTAIECGATSVMEPNDAFWGDRACSVIDQDGYEWGFGTRLEK